MNSNQSGELRILLLEDNANDAKIICHELNQLDAPFRTQRVNTRPAFLEALESFEPDVILSDYGLQRFDAIEALDLLENRPSRPVFMLVTGSQTEEVAAECIKRGADDYILKSGLRRLCPAITHALDKKRLDEEHTRALEKLRKSEERFRLFIEKTSDSFFVHDSSGRIVDANQQACDSLGYTLDELCSLQISHIEGSSASPFYVTSSRRRSEGPVRSTRESLHRRKDGSTFSVEIRSTPIEIHGHSLILSVARDISERKRAEKEIEKLVAFPHFNPNPVLGLNSNGDLIYYNEATFRLAESLGQSLPEEILPSNAKSIAIEALRTNTPLTNLEIKSASKTISWSFFPIQAINEVHCYATDITEKINLETRLRQAQRMESIGQMAAGVAHDFNNIMTIIQGYTSLLKEYPNTTTEMVSSLNQIQAATERASSLTKELLAFSRKQVIQVRPLDLTECIEKLLGMVKVTLGETIHIRCDLKKELPPVHADPSMVEEVVLNIANNARDAMPRGGQFTIRTDTETFTAEQTHASPDAYPGNFVTLSFIDTGTGMTTEIQSRIFEPFFTTKGVGQGTGMGLSTVYGIVKQHRGWVELTSKPGQGSRFKLYFPRHETPAGITAEEQPGRIAHNGGEKILLVEDEHVLREVAREILKHKGYTVYEAASGLEALGTWRQHQGEFDLVLTDLVMPEGISGRELGEKLLAENKTVKIIYTSGYSVDVNGKDSFLTEGVNFLPKPYNSESLERIIRAVLQQDT